MEYIKFYQVNLHIECGLMSRHLGVLKFNMTNIYESKIDSHAKIDDQVSTCYPLGHVFENKGSPCMSGRSH